MPRWQDYAGPAPKASLRRTKIDAIRAVGWPGGWQPDLPPSNVPTDALWDVKNMNWLPGYGLERRGGYEKVTTDVAGMDVAQQVQLRNVFVAATLTTQPSYTQEVLYYNDDDGEVWYQTMGNLLEQERDSTGADLAYSNESIGPWDSTSTNYFRTYNINSVVFEDHIYITALRFGGYTGTSATPSTHDTNLTGASLAIKYDVLNDTWTRPVAHALDGSTSGFPSARCAITQYDRIFIANTYKMSAYRYANRVYWSDAGTAETFGTNSFLTVGYDDGSEITQLLPMGDSIMVFKDDSCWMITGTDEDTFALRELSPRLGTRSSTGATYLNGIVYFFDQSQGLMSYDGATFRNVSEPINNFWKSNSTFSFNHEADFRVNVQAFGDKIAVSIPTGSDHTDYPQKTLVYDTRLEVWTYWDHGISGELAEYVTDHSLTGVGLSGADEWYTGSIDDQKGIFRLEGRVGDDETAVGDSFVDGEIMTGWITVGEVGWRHRLRRMDILTSAETTSNIDITLYRDFNSTDTWQTGTYDPDGDLQAWHHQDQGFDHGTDMWTWIQIHLNIDQTATVAKLHGYQLNTSSRPWFRGVQGNINIAPAGCKT